MTLHDCQIRAREFLEAHCPATLDSPAAQAICQGRLVYPKYSGCGDLAHALYAHLGVQHPNLNRAPGWRQGLNVSLLRTWEGAAQRLPTRRCPVDVDAGDVLIRWPNNDGNKAHVVCIVAPSVDGVTVPTAEYGQPRPMIGRLFHRHLDPRPGERPWQILLRLADVLRTGKQYWQLSVIPGRVDL